MEDQEKNQNAMETGACPSDAELVDFLQGKLAPESRQRTQAHVSSCQDCRNWIAGIRLPGSKAAASSVLSRPANLWIVGGISVAVLSLLSVSIMIFLFPKSQEMESEAGPVAAKPPQLFSPSWHLPGKSRILPERDTAPGKAFPCYHTGEKIGLESHFGEPRNFYLFTVDSDRKVSRRFPDPANKDPKAAVVPAGDRRMTEPGCEFTIEGSAGIYYLLLVASKTAIPKEELDELFKALEYVASQRGGPALFGPLESLLVHPGWEEQVIVFEQVN